MTKNIDVYSYLGNIRERDGLKVMINLEKIEMNMVSATEPLCLLEVPQFLSSQVTQIVFFPGFSTGDISVAISSKSVTHCI
jgi:hypothetical protein